MLVNEIRLMESGKFQLRVLTVRRVCIYTVCSPRAVSLLSIATYLTPFTRLPPPSPLAARPWKLLVCSPRPGASAQLAPAHLPSTPTALGA